MQGSNGNLSGGRELQYVTLKDVFLGQLCDKIIRAVNQVAQNAGVSVFGKLPAPPPIDAVNISGTYDANTGLYTCPSEILHWTLTHNGAIQKGIQYVTEIATEPNFLQPHVVDHGCSRSAFLHLPTLDTNGNTQTYYLRSFAQYQGSDATEPTTPGGLHTAVGIQMTGTSQTNLLTSTGSGTASATGQQGGQGLGTTLSRPAITPTRSIKQ
jgi:hypothetical protein